MRNLSGRRQQCINEGDDEAVFSDDRKYLELRFLQVILDFFNYHISMARREHASRMKVRWLIRNLLPSF